MGGASCDVETYGGGRVLEGRSLSILFIRCNCREVIDKIWLEELPIATASPSNANKPSKNRSSPSTKTESNSVAVDVAATMKI